MEQKPDAWRAIVGDMKFHAADHDGLTRAIKLNFDKVPDRMDPLYAHPVWQPMRTAPKDGTAILVLLDGSDIPHAVRWTGSSWRITWDGDVVSKHIGPSCWMAIPDAPKNL